MPYFSRLSRWVLAMTEGKEYKVKNPLIAGFLLSNCNPTILQILKILVLFYRINHCFKSIGVVHG